MERDLKIKLSRLESKIERLTDMVERLAGASHDAQLIPTRVAAMKLGLTPQALRKRAQRGSIDCHYDGKHYLFEVGKIESLIAD